MTIVRQQTNRFDPKTINSVNDRMRHRAQAFGLLVSPAELTIGNLGYNATTGKFALANSKGAIGALASPITSRLPTGFGSNPLSDGNSVAF